jgi:hypothetical protein
MRKRLLKITPEEFVTVLLSFVENRKKINVKRDSRLFPKRLIKLFWKNDSDGFLTFATRRFFLSSKNAVN